ncbi:1-phosphofructokinase [Microbacterium sp. SCN 69-37]|uniref:1-phosphofructokinase family hexose kinase n=1 Tax=Microbacterium sp. SCN 69-37 TaxID=1660115 RepID=UPI00086D355E|nr:1-phosphofructokinase [Microbacterium sp. SCN 69-37]ODT24780.1 MAG: 1-phosphofructokinase [Microbacterium sp. SCN 69-37]
MIVTLTANPSLDRTVTLSDALRVGEVQSALSVREDAGGKGINVTRVLAGSGVATRAVLPLDADDPFAAVLRSAHVPVLAVPLPGTARANLTLTDSDGVTTKINLPGVTRTAQDAATLIDATVRASADADWLVLAGSLPPGLSEDFYVDVITAVRAAGASAPRIAVDTSGPALREVVERGRPDLIKPNDEELVELAGVALDAELPLPEAVLAVARQLVPTRVGAAFVTLGGDGAVLVAPDGAWFGTPPPTRVRSTVGAGDSSLAGFLLADVAGAAPDERVRSGIRYGSAAAALPGTQAPTPTDLLPGDVPVRPLAL